MDKSNCYLNEKYMNCGINISAVVSNNLCTACGGCLGICPSNAIDSFETVSGCLEFKVNPDKCLNCGLCIKICPGVGFCNVLLNSMPTDPFVGTISDTWVGKATDQTIYANSQSGGVVTGLLFSAIKEGEIGGAIVVTMKSGNPPRPEVKLVSTKSELMQAQQSKYSPVPLLSIVKTLTAINYPVAIVGLPCHMHGLENMINSHPYIKEKVKYKIGLICDRVLSYAAIDYLLERAGCAGKGETSIVWRCKEVSGYPGDVKIGCQGDYIILPAKERMKIKEYFTPIRCRLCFDKLNIFADIVVGDPHGIQNIDRKNGESVIFVRTTTGQKLLETAELNGSLIIRKTNHLEAIKGQNVDEKRAYWLNYCLEWKKRKNILPNFFEKVSQCFNSYKVPKHYRSHIKYSLYLKNCDSKEEFFKFINEKIYGRNIFRKILYEIKMQLKFTKQKEGKNKYVRRTQGCKQLCQ